MTLPKRPITTGSGINIAFALVVLASYLATFSALPDISLVNLALMIMLGTAYIALGTYGYTFCVRSGSLPLQIAYFAVQIPLGGWMVYLGKAVSYNAMLLLPLAGQSVLLLPQAWMAAVNLLVAISYIASVSLATQGWSAVMSGIATFAAGQIFIIAFTQMAVSEEKSRSEVVRLVNELESANQRLREYALKVEELAIAKERNRLAREIHDGLGHYLTTIHMQIQAARAVAAEQPKRAAEALQTAQNLTQEALVDVRRSVAALRSTPDENLPLAQRIAGVLKSGEVVGLRSEMKVIGQPYALSPQAQLTLFRAAQEGMNNTCKHAHATTLWVTLDYSNPQHVQLVMHDDGVGSSNPAESQEGFGLLGLRERVQLLNGEFNVESSEGQGFTLKIMVPQ